MKRIIRIDLSADHTLECIDKVIGRSGEGLVSRLAITVPSALREYDTYIDFEKPNGETLRSPKLETESGVAYYDLPQYLLDESGEIKVQLVFEKSGGKVWKSSKKRYTILKSINAVVDIPEKEDFFSELQRLIDELNGEVQEIANALANNEKFAQNVIDLCGGQTKIITINGIPLKFFVGLQAQYEELTDGEKENLFAIITDDTSKEEIENKLKIIENYIANLTASGSSKIGTPNADSYFEAIERAIDGDYSGELHTNLLPSTNGKQNLGSEWRKLDKVFANEFVGKAHSAYSADLADLAQALIPAQTAVNSEDCEIKENGLYCFYITGDLNCSICFYVNRNLTAHSARCEVASGKYVWLSNTGAEVSVMSNNLNVQIARYYKIF